MKLERDFSTRLMQQMRSDLRGSKVIKHNDRSTAGIPDISCSWLGYTHWIEDKVLRKRDSLKDINRPDQLLFAHELSTSTNGRCWVVVFEEEPRCISIWQPRILMTELFPKFILADKFMPREPTVIEAADMPTNLNDVIKAMGAIRHYGWNYNFVTRLISDATR